jgi:hypothetical protein
MTRPLAHDFTTRICGDIGDPQSELWSMRWMRDALVALRNPFFTARVFHPQGTTLVFNTFDIPSTLLVVPMWGWASEVVIYNTAVLVAFALTAYGMACLARELTGDVLAGVLAGLLFAGVPYHYAHLRGQLHLVSMGWVPLYLVYLLRVVDDRGRERDALLAGVFLALASLASWYHLVFAVVITIPLAIAGAWRHHGLDGARRLARRATVLGLAWAVLAGPLLAAIFVARQREPILGAHSRCRTFAIACKTPRRLLPPSPSCSATSASPPSWRRSGSRSAGRKWRSARTRRPHREGQRAVCSRGSQNAGDHHHGDEEERLRVRAEQQDDDQEIDDQPRRAALEPARRLRLADQDRAEDQPRHAEQDRQLGTVHDAQEGHEAEAPEDQEERDGRRPTRHRAHDGADRPVEEREQRAGAEDAEHAELQGMREVLIERGVEDAGGKMGQRRRQQKARSALGESVGDEAVIEEVPRRDHASSADDASTGTDS